METSKFYVPLRNFSTDTIDFWNNNTVSGSPTATNLATLYPDIFWIEKNFNDEDTLCMAKVVGKSTVFTINASATSYDTIPEPFVPVPVLGNPCEIIGPHPTTVYRPGVKRP